MATLAEQEVKALDLTGQLADVVSEIVHHGPTRHMDLTEILGHIHAIQNAILAQLAARQYPDNYRLLGEK